MAAGGTWLGEDENRDECPIDCDGEGDRQVGPQDLTILLGAWGVCV